MYVSELRNQMPAVTLLEFVLRQSKVPMGNTISSMVRRSGNNTPYVEYLTPNRITNGIFADYITAAVRTGGTNSQASGISVLVIPLHVSGVTRRKLKNSGLAASASTFLEFDDVKVPTTNLLGQENQGFQIIMSSIPPDLG